MNNYATWSSVIMLTLYSLFALLLLISTQLCGSVLPANFLFPVCDNDTGVSGLIFHAMAGLSLWVLSGAYLLSIHMLKGKINTTSILFKISMIVSFIIFFLPILWFVFGRLY